MQVHVGTSSVWLSRISLLQTADADPPRDGLVEFRTASFAEHRQVSPLYYEGGHGDEAGNGVAPVSPFLVRRG